MGPPSPVARRRTALSPPRRPDRNCARPRRAGQDLTGPRARGLHARTIEELDQRGIAERFLSQGRIHPSVSFHRVPLHTRDLPTRHNYVLALGQKHFERILAAWVEELPVTFHRGREVAGFAQDDAGVDVALSDGRSLRAEYLVACDGGRSLVRKCAGIAFPGWEPTVSWLIAEVELTREPRWGFHEDALGIHAIGRSEDGRSVGVVLTERELRRGGEPTLREVSEALVAVYGTDFGIHSPRFISRFTDMARQAAAYRDRRILLAGDAAHVHPPVGGQGLNLGVQDAVNLGWKLAQVVRRSAPDSLLDTYHAERHPVAARVMRSVMAQVALRRTDDRSKALGETVSALLVLDEPRRRLAAEVSGLDIRYDLGQGHPLVGRRVPDLDLETAAGRLRLFTLLHAARPLLLDLGGAGGVDTAPWADRVPRVAARCAGPWELPVIGPVTPPTALLIRPDGYVAWTGDPAERGLEDALTRWFGPAGAA